MIEQGIIIKKDKDSVICRVDKKDECSKCGMCLFPKNSTHIDFNCKCELNVNIGDKVKLERNENGKLFGALLVFGVPLLIIIACVLIGYFVFNSEIVIFASSIFFCVLWEIALYFIDKKIKKLKSFTAKVIDVVEVKDQTNGEN